MLLANRVKNRLSRESRVETPRTPRRVCSLVRSFVQRKQLAIKDALKASSSRVGWGVLRASSLATCLGFELRNRRRNRENERTLEVGEQSHSFSSSPRKRMVTCRFFLDKIPSERRWRFRPLPAESSELDAESGIDIIHHRQVPCS